MSISHITTMAEQQAWCSFLQEPSSTAGSRAAPTSLTPLLPSSGGKLQQFSPGVLRET